MEDGGAIELSEMTEDGASSELCVALKGSRRQVEERRPTPSIRLLLGSEVRSGCTLVTLALQLGRLGSPLSVPRRVAVDFRSVPHMVIRGPKKRHWQK